MTSVVSAEEALKQLSPFQRRTAVYAFQRLYDSDNPSTRFLVADEVGLGKTHVARGVIAQIVDHLRSQGDKRIDIVYICSNATIARQNLRKLNVADDDAIVEADRLTLLLKTLHVVEKRSINLIAITPRTSLEFGRRAGKFEERVLLFALLRRIWGDDAVRSKGAARLFYYGIKDDASAAKKLREEASKVRVPRSVVAQIRQQIKNMNAQRRAQGQPTLKIEFNRLVNAFQYKNGYTEHDLEQRSKFLVDLRRTAATVAIKALRPDLVILDEFQRFRSLLDPDHDSWANQLTRELFEFRDPESGRLTRMLLLSATPYRPYTTIEDAESDTHFEDLLAIANFLFGDQQRTKQLRDDLRELRHSLLGLSHDVERAVRACDRVADDLRPVMSRTEKLASTPDRNGMLNAAQARLFLQPSDVEGYVGVAQAAKILNQGDVTEYWKSAPYLLNFMEGYELKRELDRRLGDGNHSPELKELVKDGKGLLKWNEVRRYGKVDPGNARLRWLIEDTIGRGIWRLLWLPPALPYYAAGGPFDDPHARSFTKRLIFSSWQVVPKVISAMLSFEAERAVFDEAGERSSRSYDEFGKRPGQLLEFGRKSSGGGLEGMPLFLLIAPFAELARLTDPLELASRKRRSAVPSRSELEALARRSVSEALEPLLKSHRKTGEVDRRWYWVAPLLLDREADYERTVAWFAEAWPSWWTGNADDDHSETFVSHLDRLWRVAEAKERRPLGRVPKDLVDVLVATGFGSPAICALRAVSRITGIRDLRNPILLSAACRIAWGFRSLFNGTEATAVVRSVTGMQAAHWRAVLEYCVRGNLQAVLDEYLHVLKDWQGFIRGVDEEHIADLVELVVNALTLRTTNYVVEIPQLRRDRVSLKRHMMRGRFATRFGDKTIETEERLKRADQVKLAFNSPFWPFVLATTSIGQEGLDFHLYSHAVVHWNLPSNPVDFEQREGRVHRYKGHAIRKNVAHLCRDAALRYPDRDPWAAMFDDAHARHGSGDGLEPYWVFHPDGAPAAIERFVLALPLSRDAIKYERMRRLVAIYRLAFGQPHQAHLIEFLQGQIPEDDLALLVDRLKVDLTPPAVSA